MKKLITVLLSLLIVLSFTACTKKNNNDDGPHVIKIGYVENLTGKSSNSGSLCKRGIDLAHELNNKVTIKPFKVISATSWLSWGGYAANKMLLPTTCCINSLTLAGDHKEIIVTM